MEPGYFTSKQFAIAAAVAATLLAGAAAAWSLGDDGVVARSAACDAPAPMGTPLQVTPQVARADDGSRETITYVLPPGDAIGGIVHACTGIGEILVSPSPDGDAHVQLRVSGDADAVSATRHEARFARLDDRLVLQAWVVEHASASSVFGRRAAHVVLTLQLPETGPYSVEARADVGDVGVQGLLLSDVRLQADVGDARALDVHLAGDATLSSDVGEVVLSAQSVQSGTIRLSTRVDDAEARLPLRADVGYEVNASTRVGDIELDIGPTETSERDGEGVSASARARSAGYASKPTQVRVEATVDVGSLRIVAR